MSLSNIIHYFQCDTLNFLKLIVSDGLVFMEWNHLNGRVKVLVLGRHGVGKTTLMKRLIGSNVLTIDDKNGSTIALDYGKLTYDGVNFHFFGSPGHERFRFMVDILSRGANISLLVIDSAAGILRKDLEYAVIAKQIGAPIIVAANKQDIPGAASAETIAEALSPWIGRPGVVPVSARTGYGCLNLLSNLVDLASIILKGKITCKVEI